MSKRFTNDAANREPTEPQPGDIVYIDGEKFVAFRLDSVVWTEQDRAEWERENADFQEALRRLRESNRDGEPGEDDDLDNFKL